MHKFLCLNVEPHWRLSEQWPHPAFWLIEVGLSSWYSGDREGWLPYKSCFESTAFLYTVVSSSVVIFLGRRPCKTWRKQNWGFKIRFLFNSFDHGEINQFIYWYTVLDVKWKIHNELLESLVVIKEEELLILLRSPCLSWPTLQLQRVSWLHWYQHMKDVKTHHAGKTHAQEGKHWPKCWALVKIFLHNNVNM